MRKCHETSKSVQARTDSTRTRKHCPLRRKARLSHAGGQKKNIIINNEEEEEERGRRMQVPTGTPHTHSQP